MIFQASLFYIFALIILFAAIKVVISKNPVHSALWLVLSICTSACMWMLMQAEFLGIVLIMIYVGAVMVLFLFVVMMLNINLEEMHAGFWRNLPVSFSVGILMAVVLILILINPQTNLASFGQLRDIPADYDSVRALGLELFAVYVLPFELGAVLLLLGMVAAIALVHRKNTNPRYIQPGDQVKVDPNKGRYRMVKMAAVIEDTADDEPETDSETADKGDKS